MVAKFGRQQFPYALGVTILLLLQLGADFESSARAQPSGMTIMERSIVHDQRDRFYLVARPASYCPGNPAIVVLHGGSLGMRRILDQTTAPNRWLSLADDYGLLILAPNGWNVSEASGATDNQSWNDLRPDIGNPISTEDDAGFINAMLDREDARLGFDNDAVFVTGSSNGGMMAYRMLIEHSERFAAGAAFIANLPEADIPDPTVGRPVMIMNGDADPLMLWAGGTVGFAGAPVRSALASLAYWRRVNGVDSGGGSATILPDIDPTDGARVLRYLFATEISGNPDTVPRVAFYQMVNGGHAIPVLPNDPQEPLPPLIGTRCRDVRGVDLAWSFFQQHLSIGESDCDPCARGDLNLDGSVDLSDVEPFVDVLLAPQSATDDVRCLADLDDNGTVNGRDVAVVVATLLSR